MNSTWAWRIPSAVQGVFSIFCIIIIPFIPESPRWLVYQQHHEEALDVVAYMYADGDRTNALVSAQYKEIMDTIEYEKNAGATLSVKQLFKTPSARKRVTLAMSAAIFSTIAGMFIIFIPSSYSHSVQGNVIASYYLGTMLDNAGITNSTVQLEIVRTLTKNFLRRMALTVNALRILSSTPGVSSAPSSASSTRSWPL